VNRTTELRKQLPAEASETLSYEPSDIRKRVKLKTKLHGLSPRANYTDRATAACRRSECQRLRIKGATCQRDGSLGPYSRFSKQEPLLFYQVAPQLYSRGWVDPVPDPQFFFSYCRESNPGLRICSQELWPLDHRGGHCHSIQFLIYQATVLYPSNMQGSVKRIRPGDFQQISHSYVPDGRILRNDFSENLNRCNKFEVLRG
jgi:hypothetical protein